MTKDSTVPEANHIIEALQGDWEIVRRVLGSARLRGTAAFSPIGKGELLYKEVGTLVLINGHKTNAQREYVFAAALDGFDVFFKESPARLFHEVRFMQSGDHLVADCEHLCAADKYRSRYRWHSFDCFSVLHRVNGPHKDYRMATIYKRKCV